MKEEALFIQGQLNGFAQQILAAGVDAHVVVIAATLLGGQAKYFPLCVPEPLAGPWCGDNPPVYNVVDRYIGSSNALAVITQSFSEWQGSVRPDAKKHFVVITDDQSGMAAPVFDQTLRALAPGTLDGYAFHAIYCQSACPWAAAVGTVYGELAATTGGVAGDLCTQNFQPVWDAVAAQVIDSATLECEWEIPAPPTGESLDPTHVNVRVTAGGVDRPLGHTGGPHDCAGIADGWHYDDPLAPTRVVACPQTCAALQGLADARVDLLFGCATEPARPD